jgi:hypothetical protein
VRGALNARLSLKASQDCLLGGGSLSLLAFQLAQANIPFLLFAFVWIAENSLGWDPVSTQFSSKTENDFDRRCAVDSSNPSCACANALFCV